MVKFETILNKESTETLNKFSMKKLTLFYVFFSVLFVFLGLVNFVSEEPNIFVGVFLIAVGVLFYPLNVVLVKIFKKKTDSSMPILSDETVVDFTFYDDKIVIEEKRSNDYRALTETAYRYYYKVYETQTHYFLYISKHQCQVIPKADLKEGTLDELNLLFIKNLGPDKFVLKKK